MWDFQKYKDNIAFITEEGISYSYRDIFLLQQKFSCKIEKRCLIFILCKNSLESLLAYIACIENKIVPLLLESTIVPQFLQELIKVYQPSYLWMPLEKKQNIKFSYVYQYNDYVLVKNMTEKEVFLHSDLALLLSTSGSTGSKKLVRVSYQNIYANMRDISIYLKLNTLEKAITSLPMQYSYGLSVINSHLYVGATILITQKTIMNKEFWSFFNQYGGTSIAGVPYTYEILKKLNFNKMQLPTLKTMTQAGGKLAEDTKMYFAAFAQKTNREFFVMYGQTEATARISYLLPKLIMDKKGSIGIAIPHGKLSLQDEQGVEITCANTLGELVYAGENVTMGYAQCIEELAMGDCRKGILPTGDIGYYDQDGYFYILGRKNQYIKISGKRIALPEVEELLKKQFQNSEFVCIDLDEKIGIITKGKNTEQEICKFISKVLSMNIKLFYVKKCTEIPINENQKINYKMVYQLLNT